MPVERITPVPIRHRFGDVELREGLDSAQDIHVRRLVIVRADSQNIAFFKGQVVCSVDRPKPVFLHVVLETPMGREAHALVRMLGGVGSQNSRSRSSGVGQGVIRPGDPKGKQEGGKERQSEAPGNPCVPGFASNGVEAAGDEDAGGRGHG